MRAFEAGEQAGGELKQLKSASLLVVRCESFPFVDLRVDLDPQPLSELRFLWELYQPSADAYVMRVSCAPSIPTARQAAREQLLRHFREAARLPTI